MPSRSPNATMASDLTISPWASTAAATSPISISEKYSGGADRGRHGREGRAGGRDRRRPRGAGEEGPNGGDGEPGSGAARGRHLVPVDAGHHRRGLARQIDQDGGGRAAILGAVVDA